MHFFYSKVVMWHSLLAGAWLNPSFWITLPHCLFSVLVTVSPVLIDWLFQAVQAPSCHLYRHGLGIVKYFLIFLWFLLAFLFLVCVQKKGKPDDALLPRCVGLAQLLLSAWEKERLDHCWLSLCTQTVLGTTDHPDSSFSGVPSVGTGWCCWHT